MKIKDYICKCGCDDFVIIPQKPDTIGIYCTKCGKWLKWADKDEKNLMKIQQDQCIDKSILDELRDAIDDIDEGITSYRNDRPWVFKDEVLQIIDKYRERKDK